MAFTFKYNEDNMRKDGFNMKQLSVICIGAGLRGMGYTNIMANSMSDKFRVVAVAEPVDDRRRYMVEKHGIAPENTYEDWQPLLAREKMADIAVIATMDRDHVGPALAAIEKGYHLLLEKPISPIAEECLRVAEAAEKKGVHVLICHVLRFTPFFNTLKNIIDSGKIGDVKSIVHCEYVGNVHQSHSFVRGNWSNSRESSPMILQKSCHDMDILQWLVGKECKYVQSFGSLSYFNAANKPEGAADRCIDCGVRENCPYNAVKLYPAKAGWFSSAATKKINPTQADIDEALANGPYGKCVFASNNDVVDHQVVNLEFEDDVTVSFTMAAFCKGGRELRILGTKGELSANMDCKTVSVYSFDTQETEEIDVNSAQMGNTLVSGHGGGDTGIVEAMYGLVTGQSVHKGICTARRSAENHLIALAAEISRCEHRVISMDEYRKSVYANL